MFSLRSKHKRGFTIIELIVASGISSMLMWSIYMIFNNSNKLSNLLEGEFEVRQNARAVFSRMELDLTGAFLDRTGNYFYFGKDSLRFVSSAPCDELQYNRLVPHPITEAAYSVSGSEIVGNGVKVKKLYRKLDYDDKTSTPVSAGANEWDLLCENVVDFRMRRWNLEHTDEEDDHWDTNNLSVKQGSSDTLPGAIKVILRLTDRRGAVQRTFFNVIPVGQGR